MRYLEIARKVSAQSTHPKHAVGAVVVRGGAILSAAANSGRWHRCAEKRALRHRHYFKGSVIYVARSNGGCSKPCDECMNALREAGIRLVVYRNAQGKVEEMLV